MTAPALPCLVTARKAVIQGLATTILLGLMTGLPGWPPTAGASAKDSGPTADMEKDVTQGALRIPGQDGGVVECPLKHTEVRAAISGFLARVRVTQTFQNPTQEKIEAVYVFPLPHEAAVDDMTMVIADRKIVGLIKRRAEARQIYEQALSAGQTAALLEQERPNIFTQSVGNIPPGGEVQIEISYVDVLQYDLGSYEFYFPMVVGPRYNPGAPIASPAPNPPGLQRAVSPPVPDTTRVPDASRISPPVLKPGFRNGHDIRLSVSLDAGVPIQNLAVPNHRSDVRREGPSHASVTLSPQDSLPNKDFVLRYDVVGKQPELAVLAHTGEHATDARRLGRGYFMLMIQPQEDERLTKSPPRELVFLVDVSGSMSGLPTAKVIEAMQNMLKLCRPVDTVQVITFASQANKLFEQAVPVKEENIQRALNFTQGLQGGGGTEMLKGVQLAIDEPLDKQRVRIVVMLTDGYIGNEAEIIEHVGRRCGDRIRFWALGIGSSPNMFLIDGVAKQGGGMGKRLGLEDDSQALTQEVMTRIQRAQLAEIRVEWGGLQVAETYPARIPELWAGRPVILYGRYLRPGQGVVTVRGTVEGQDAAWPVQVEFPAAQEQHDVLAKVWARQKIESLMQSTYYAGSPAVEEEVTSLALDYRLMSQYTSFVAVDSSQAQEMNETPAPPRRMLVPVPLPEGTRWEGFFGETEEAESLAMLKADFNFGQLARQAMPRDALDRPGRTRGAMPMYKLAEEARRFDARRFGGRTPAAHGLALRAQTYASTGPAAESAPHPIAPAPAPGWQGAPFGHSPAGTGADRLLALRETKEESDVERLDLGVDVEGVQKRAENLLAAAKVASQKAEELENAGQLAAAWAEQERACVLLAAAGNWWIGDGPQPEQALAAVERLHQKLAADWAQRVPGLDKRLDLVLRDRSLEQAVAEVAKAAGVPVVLRPGSVADAAELLGQSPRVDFLDLRHATVRQALDWILGPARLTWWLDGEQVVAGSARRRAGVSTWVYDVARLSVPTKQELAAIRDPQQAAKSVSGAADAFLQALGRELKIGEASLAWYAPGQLIVVADVQGHAAVAQWLAGMADADYAVPADLAELHRTTVRRAAERAKSAAARARAADLRRVAGLHLAYSWPLLSAASDGRVELEALTQLQIAWKSASTGELLKPETAAIVLRSLWTITEAAAALPDCGELRTLAESATARAQPALAQTLAGLPQKLSQPDAVVAAAYASLVLGRDPAARARLLRVWAAIPPGDTPAAVARPLVDALLAESASIPHDRLTALAGSGVEGDDLVVLAAIACRRAGGRTWETFRARSAEWLGQQPLPGDVVVLISRLSGAPLPLVAVR